MPAGGQEPVEDARVIGEDHDAVLDLKLDVPALARRDICLRDIDEEGDVGCADGEDARVPVGVALAGGVEVDVEKDSVYEHAGVEVGREEVDGVMIFDIGTGAGAAAYGVGVHGHAPDDVPVGHGDATDHGNPGGAEAVRVCGGRTGEACLGAARGLDGTLHEERGRGAEGGDEPFVAGGAERREEIGLRADEGVEPRGRDWERGGLAQDGDAGEPGVCRAGRAEGVDAEGVEVDVLGGGDGGPRLQPARAGPGVAEVGHAHIHVRRGRVRRERERVPRGILGLLEHLRRGGHRGERENGQHCDLTCHRVPPFQGGHAKCKSRASASVSGGRARESRGTLRLWSARSLAHEKAPRRARGFCKRNGRDSNPRYRFTLYTGLAIRGTNPQTQTGQAHTDEIHQAQPATPPVNARGASDPRR